MKKQMGWGILVACLALPLAAQDEAPAEADVAAPEQITEDAVVIDDGSDAAVSEEAAPSDDSAMAADADSSYESESSGDDTGDSASEEGGGLGLNLYVGLEYDQTTVDLDDDQTEAAFGGGNRFDADFYKLRLGARLFESVGLELHAGFPASDASNDELEVKQFYGLYLVPTGVLMEMIEVSARLGYAFVELENDQGSEDADGASFGLGAELPLRAFGESLPNLRIGVGATVYQEQRSGRMYGFHGGIRYDFSL